MRTLLLFAALLPADVFADDTITLAVASNFAETAAELAADFSKSSGLRVRISSGSTGKLYAQIVNGAPFDVFLSADAERPRLLERSGHGVSGTRTTYATGALVLWSGDEKLRGRDCREVLQRGDYGRLALANPETAPYGAAAKTILVEAGLWEYARKYAVFGENIAQTLQFVATGNATLGFVAASQMGHRSLPPTSCQWRAPPTPILEQQLVLLHRAADDEAARRFVQYLGGDAAAAIIKRHGYGLVR